MAGLVWAKKYAPVSLAQFAGNSDVSARAKRWALEWERGNAGKPLCLWGPPGIGKSALTFALASELGWERTIFSAHDSPSADLFKKRLSGALSGGALFAANSIVVLEEVDTWSKAGMRGIVSELASHLHSARVPTILTATDWYDRSLVPLRTLVEPIQMKAMNSSDLERVLTNIAQSEKLALSEDTIPAIATHSSGDLRAAINDLQASNPIASRERVQQIFQKVRMSMRAPNYRASRSFQIGALADRDMLKMYVAENMPSEFPDLADRARAYSRLSRADIFDGRIKRKQHWGYLRYSSDLMVWGVASERLHPGPAFASYAFPSYLQKMGASRSRRAIFKSISAKIAEKSHVTTRRARDFFPLLAAQNDAAALCAYWGFDEEEITALLSYLSSSPKPAALRRKPKSVSTPKAPSA